MKKAVALLAIFFCAFLFCPSALGADTDQMLEEQLEESGYYSLFSVLPGGGGGLFCRWLFGGRPGGYHPR